MVGDGSVTPTSITGGKKNKNLMSGGAAVVLRS